MTLTKVKKNYRHCFFVIMYVFFFLYVDNYLEIVQRLVTLFLHFIFHSTEIHRTFDN